MPSTLQRIRRYPVKAMGGETLTEVQVEQRGLLGDRRFAVTDEDGRLACGKNSTRFRRHDPVFRYAAATEEAGVTVTRDDGEQPWPVGSPGLDGELTTAFGVPVRVLPETDVPHFDDGAVSLVGTASLAWCHEQYGVDTDPRRLRVNLLVETDEPFVEETWREPVRVGDVLLQAVKEIERCRTVDLAQDGVPGTTRLLKALGGERDLCLGVYLSVLEPGVIRVGDRVGPV